MGLLELDVFGGTAEVLGRVVRIEWRRGDACLVIFGMERIEDAKRAIEALAIDRLAVAKLPVEAASSSAVPPAPAAVPAPVEPVPELAVPAPLPADAPAAEPEKASAEAPPVVEGLEALAVRLAAAGKLRDVLAGLIEAGYDTPDKLVEVCSAIKDRVPVLGKIVNLDERVRRMAAVAGIGGEA